MTSHDVKMQMVAMGFAPAAVLGARNWRQLRGGDWRKLKGGRVK
jgi:hypothetical protein